MLFFLVQAEVEEFKKFAHLIIKVQIRLFNNRRLIIIRFKLEFSSIIYFGSLCEIHFRISNINYISK